MGWWRTDPFLALCPSSGWQVGNLLSVEGSPPGAALPKHPLSFTAQRGAVKKRTIIPQSSSLAPPRFLHDTIEKGEKSQ